MFEKLLWKFLVFPGTFMVVDGCMGGIGILVGELRPPLKVALWASLLVGDSLGFPWLKKGVGRITLTLWDSIGFTYVFFMFLKKYP